MEHKKTDLRILRTKKAIRDAFSEMILEMDYQKITVKELSERAMINRNTFYLHYETIDELMEEMQEEIISGFVDKQISYKNINDLRYMIKVFFESTANGPKLHERLMCSGSYQFVYDSINKKIMEHRRAENKGAFGLDEYSESIIFSYYGSVSALLYRQWVEDGKKLSLEEVISLATKLICQGMESVVKN